MFRFCLILINNFIKPVPHNLSSRFLLTSIRDAQITIEIDVKFTSICSKIIISKAITIYFAIFYNILAWTQKVTK